MKLLAALGLLFTTAAQAIETDKVVHFGTSAALTGAFYLVYHKAFRMPVVPSLVFSAATVLLIGVAKEGMDAVGQNHAFDHKDMIANTIGVLTASAVLYKLEF